MVWGVSMGKIICTRRLTFAAGHRVYKHESKCAWLHGHNYVVEIDASAEQLDAVGRVIDFSVLKEKVGGWLDLNWDHAFIVSQEDGEARMHVGAVQGQKLYTMPSNPTAENMAQFLLMVVCPSVLKDTGVAVTRVVVHETENCKAEAVL